MKQQTTHINCRRATIADAAIIALLARVTFTETFGYLFKDQQDLIDYYNSTFSVAKIENSFSKPNNQYWIAFVNKLPVGYAKLKLNSVSDFIDLKSVCQLQKIYVLQNFLSMKIGFELQNLVFKKAQEKGFETLWLSVLKSNMRAVKFYRKNGFETIGEHDFSIGKENFEFIAMAKTLK